MKNTAKIEESSMSGARRMVSLPCTEATAVYLIADDNRPDLQVGQIALVSYHPADQYAIIVTGQPDLHNAAADLLEAAKMVLKRGYRLEAGDHEQLTQAVFKATGHYTLGPCDL